MPVHFDCPDTFALDRLFVQLRVDTTHQSARANTDTHLAVHHESDAAEHLPLRNSRHVGECRSHSVGQGFPRCHGDLYPKWWSPPPNASRLSCGALKKDSFLNLRAPPASSAC